MAVVIGDFMLLPTIKHLIYNMHDKWESSPVWMNSYKHYHVRGVNYINLLRSPNLTLKIYIFRPNKVALNDNKLLVAPHTHLYNFDTTVLVGRMTNIFFKESEVENLPKYQKIKYVAPKHMSSEKKSHKIGHTYLQVSQHKTYRPGESYYVDTSQIHSLYLDTAKYNAIFLQQYSTLDDYSYLYTQNEIKYDGLYEKFSKDEIGTLIDELILNMGL
jgi:hypothetical protein